MLDGRRLDIRNVINYRQINSKHNICVVFAHGILVAYSNLANAVRLHIAIVLANNIWSSHCTETGINVIWLRALMNTGNILCDS